MGLLSTKNLKEVQRLLREQERASQSAIALTEEETLGRFCQPQSNPQRIACESTAYEVLYGGAAGGGKAQPAYGMGWAFQNLNQFTGDNYLDVIHLVPEEIRCMDSKVLTWTGAWKSFSEIQVGDNIMNPDGRAQTITEVHELGVKPSYQFSFEDGTTVKCSEGHLWGVWPDDGKEYAADLGDRIDPAIWTAHYRIKAKVKSAKWIYKAMKRCGDRFMIPLPYVLGGKRIVSIELIEPVYSRCIKVSGANNLYITDGYNVTHNTSSIVIKATTLHRRSIVFRRIYDNLKEVMFQFNQVLDGIAKYNSRDKIWTGIPGDRVVEFGTMQYLDDWKKYKGRPHDGKFFDELTEFEQEQYEFAGLGWCRTTILNQICQVFSSTNPPTNLRERWIVKRWAPWLDKNHPNRAMPGEMRWFAMIGGQDTEVESPEPFTYFDEDNEIEIEVVPTSRTFIPALVDDNPYLAGSGYKQRLLNMPEPMRSQLAFGSFDAGMQDGAYQLIPTAWIEAAVNRWKARINCRYEVIGVDVARSADPKADRSALARRIGFWVDKIETYGGGMEMDGDILALAVKMQCTNETIVHIDVSGLGTSPYDFLRKKYLGKGRVKPINFGAGSKKHDLTGLMRFLNKRAEIYWNLRDLLDPKNGFEVELPPDDDLKEELAAHTYEFKVDKNEDFETEIIVQIASKDEVKKILGRSPDKSDSVACAFADTSDREDHWLKRYVPIYN